MIFGSGTRERIIGEALRLFAERGYRGTTIADIEAASGLSPGSGGLYTHFRSKEELLAEAVNRSIEVAQTPFGLYEALPLGDLRSELILVARGSLMVMNNWETLIRIMWKEIDQFPELLGAARRNIVEGAYRWLGEWFRVKVDAGELMTTDPEATAVIALGSISNYWLHTTLLGGRPNGVDDERFVESWVDLVMRLSHP